MEPDIGSGKPAEIDGIGIIDHPCEGQVAGNRGERFGEEPEGHQQAREQLQQSAQIQSSEKLVISQKAMRPKSADIRNSSVKDSAQKATNIKPSNRLAGGSMP